MPGTPTINTFNGLAPPWSLASLDANFVNVTTLLASLNNYSNYYVDTGAANAYVVTLSAGQTASLAAGLPVQFIAVNANTGASTLNVNGTGIKNVLRCDASTLAPGDITNGMIVTVIYDGTQYQILNPRRQKSFMAFSAAANQAAGSTRYLGPGTDFGTEGPARILVPFACVVRNMYAEVTAAPGGAETCIVTFRKNSAASAVTTTITGAATNNNDVTHNVSLAANDTIDVQSVTSGGAAALSLKVSFEVDI